ncbi:MAG: tyrosine-type recombinase/integrase [Lachnospiraceae bacterium]|nr:tyrosine-type recombinase/integrase [Lachnospiraceae bacterium]
MARRGENIYKRKDNRWEGRYVSGYDDNGKAKIGYVYAKTYREVREKLHQAKALGKASFQKGKNKFSDYCDEWLVLARNRVKESTYVKYCGVVQKHLKPALGQYAPEVISTLLVESFSNKLLITDGLTPKTVKDVLAVLRSVLKYMNKQHGGSLNDIEIIYPKETPKEMRVLSKEEQTRLIRYLLTDMDEVKFGIILVLLTGMRIGEICALKWKDINLEFGIITINHTMQRLSNISEEATKKTKIVIGDTKSTYSKRTIPLPEYAINICKYMQPANTEAYVLSGDTNRFIEPRTLQNKLKKFITACNISGVHFHSLRHTFATRCVEVDFEIKSLSEILGHANTRITLDRYVHSSLELKKANMEKLCFSSISSQNKPSEA